MSNFPKASSQLSADAKRKLLADLLAKKVRAEAQEIPSEYYRFEDYPEYQQLREQRAQIHSLGLTPPYFSSHEGIAADVTHIDGKPHINYSAYNYLGLSGHPAVSEAAKQAIDEYGTSVSASRPASGQKQLHLDLEREIADFLGVEDCLTYVAGHLTNVSTIGHLFSRDDIIFYDTLSHNSIYQGCLLSGAKVIPFPHNDADALEKLLVSQRYKYRRALITIEGVYSADGDIPHLPDFIALKQEHKTFLMVDEAHSIGVLGEKGSGIGEHFGINPTDVDLWMGTLSKSFASCGGYIAGGQAVVDYLKYTSPGFIFSIGMSPPNTAAALAALRVLKAEPERVKKVQHNANLFVSLAQARGLDTGQSQHSPIVPIMVKNTVKAIELSQKMMQRGINVQPMTFPVVPHNAARLRFFISSTHSEAQIRETVDALTEEVAKLML
ncbi:aminotransferase class I/II-fold pyridoxal phosphate-dependent enzyme [Lyngbya confervoides]|uniref:Aminotransferase class I/II-fold pyridoxal phosphate-dependent enzyme n=1 Tax=Lyngbya confervoides BDU141951 TaxID=1574623 RepID=A0ABD4T8K6_9CYAN|nr:aminotransferase class I/II-fold pyridoxal phosphate-dependent enzyme [Lyngbya confervoides]MCM1984981.1 aminotransferase class I/II-fold pyridoxal phosphate-dependent enzyme [Lyngbya confervoides BDU141951]